MKRLSTILQRISRMFRSRDRRTESVEVMIEHLSSRDEELNRQLATLRATTRAQTFRSANN